MKKQEFLKSVRRGKEKFRADDIVVSTAKGEFHGKGIVEIANGRFRIQVTLSTDTPCPELPQGIIGHRDFWLIKGVIEDEIGFKVHSLPSKSTQNSTFGQLDKSALEFSANWMELTPTAFECLTNEDLFEMQRQANPNAPAEQTTMKALPTASEECDVLVTKVGAQSVKVTFHAVLPDFKLIECNEGTETTIKNVFLGESSHSSLDTFQGEMSGWKYGLIQREGDLLVHFLSKPEHQSLGDAHDRGLFHAFLTALAFMHAQHAWPFSVEHRRDGKLLTNYIQLNKNITHSPHAPFSEALAFNNRTKNLTWSFGAALESAYKFFSSDSRLAREVETVLFIFREATGRGIPKRIALLSLCSLFESLVRAVHEEEIAPKSADANAEFQRVKKEVCENLLKKGQPAYGRLAAILKPAEPVNNRMRYDAVIEYLGLKPSAYWQELYGLWSKFRNPISHRMAKEDKSEDSIKDELIAESRIAGAINCMILRLMNYSGYVRLSVYEDKYGQI